MLRLRSLGKTLIEADDARLTPSAETVFAMALYLIVEAGRPVGRDELTRMLWPGVSEARAQHGLRQALYRLKVLGATIKADRTSLILAPRFCTTDFSSLVTPQPTATLEQLAETIEGSFLPGYHPELSDEFTAWVDRQRDVVHSAVARALMAGMQAKKRVSDWSGAERLASMCLSIDPLNEEATLTVAEAAALGGSKARALSILNTYIKDIGTEAGEIKLPAELLRRRISEAYRDSSHSVKETPFVGREEETAELTRALAEVQRCHGVTYVIVGEPGIGKTRLMAEFTRVALLQPIRIVRVGCQPHDVRRPASAFVDLVPQLLSLPGALGCSPETMQYLRRLTAHDPGEARNRADFEQSDVSYSNARGAFMDVLDAISVETSAVIEIEDGQWLDPLSKQLIEELTNWIVTRRILFILTSRTCVLAGERIRELTLRPLPPSAGTTVAKALTAMGSRISSDFLDWCVSSSGGNPYYLIELVRNGTEKHNGYRAPESLKRLLQNRVSMLSEEARSLLQVCCVLGKHSTAQRVEAAIEIPRVTLLRSLNELDSSGMIEVDGDRILSRHDLLTIVVLEQMSEAVRVMLHRFAATQLEAEADFTRSVSLTWESAEHWISSSDSARAVLLLRRCGNHLLGVAMPDEAVQVLERAKSLVATASEQYQIGIEIVRALMHAERSREAASVIDCLLLLKNTIHPTPSPLDELSLMALEARWVNGSSIPEIMTDGLAALSLSGGTANERIAVASWLLTAADNLCEIDTGRRIYQRVAGQLSSQEVEADTRLWLEMVYHATCGDRMLAEGLAFDLIQYARTSSPPIVAIRYLRHAAHVLNCYNTPESAISVLIESFEWAKKLDARVVMAITAGMLSSIHMQNGDNVSARTWINCAFDVHRPADTIVTDVNMWSYRAELALRIGDSADAHLALTGCFNAAESSKSKRSLVRYRSLQLQFMLLTGQKIEDSFLDSLISLHDATKKSLFQDYTVESLLLGLENADRLLEAERIGAQYACEFRRATSPLSVPLAVLISRLQLLSMRGD